MITAVDPTFWYQKTSRKFSDGISTSCSSDKCNRDNFKSIINEKQSNENSRSVNKPLKRTLSIRKFLVERSHFYQIGGLRALSPNPLLMYSANMKDSKNSDRWLAALSSSIVH